MQHQNSRQAFSTKVTIARSHRCVPAASNNLLERAANITTKSLVGFTKGADAPLAPLRARVDVLGLAAWVVVPFANLEASQLPNA